MAMLRPEYGIRKLLVDTAAVTSLLGDSDGIGPMGNLSRVARMPYIGVQRSGGAPEHHLGGVSASGLWQGGSEVTVFAETPEDAHAVSEAVRAALDGGQGTTATVGADSVTFTLLNLIDTDDGMVPPKDGSDDAIYMDTLEFEWGVEP